MRNKHAQYSSLYTQKTRENPSQDNYFIAQ